MVTWPFTCPWAISYRCSIGNDTLSPRDFEILRLKCIWVTVLTFLGHVTSSVTWPLDSPHPTSYRCSIGTDTLSISKEFWDIEAQIYLGHGYDLSGSCDVIGHVTIRFPTPHFLQVIHWYWRSISKEFWDIEAQMYLGHGYDLSRSRDRWRHRSRDHSFRGMWFHIGGLLITGTVTEIFGCKGPITPMSSQACISLCKRPYSTLRMRRVTWSG